MAEESSELKENSGVLSESDKKIVSSVAGSSDDAFIEKFSNERAETGAEGQEAQTDTDENSEETEQLKAQIVETRKEMGETIDAIQEKLSIANISEQVKDQVSEHISDAFETAKDTVYGATLGKMGGFMKNVNKGVNEISKLDVVQKAWQNPAALSLIGLGLGMLLVNAYSKRSYDYKRKSRKGLPASERAAQNRPSALRAAQDRVTGAASGAYENVSNVTGSAYESVSGAASSAYESVTDVAGDAYSGVNDFAHQAYGKVGDYGSQAREQYDYHIEENPLAVGAVAFAVGAAIGMAIPSTAYESELLGEYRQQVFDKAQSAAGDLVGKVKEVASEAQKTLGEEVKTAVGETQKRIGDEAKKQGLTQ